MSFIPFGKSDFLEMENLRKNHIPKKLENNINELRNELGQYPEFDLEFFSKRIVRRPKMRGIDGLVFGKAKLEEKYWFLYIAGGDQDQVQLNIGMGKSHIRVGLGFQIGRQVFPKIPAFNLLQTFLGIRPPLPFRDSFYKCIKKNDFRLEDYPDITDSKEIIYLLETFVVPSDKNPTFVFIGKIWNPIEASSKSTEDYREVFRELMPFYEELLLAGGRFSFYI